MRTRKGGKGGRLSAVSEKSASMPKLFYQEKQKYFNRG